MSFYAANIPLAKGGGAFFFEVPKGTPPKGGGRDFLGLRFSIVRVRHICGGVQAKKKEASFRRPLTFSSGCIGLQPLSSHIKRHLPKLRRVKNMIAKGVSPHSFKRGARITTGSKPATEEAVAITAVFE
jgi:hypothetical protein